MRVKKWPWWRIARELNRDGVRHVTQDEPWTRSWLKEWYRRHTARPDKARIRLTRRRMYRRIAVLYMLHREHEDRVQRVLHQLRQEFGHTPNGGTISRQWVSGVAAELGIRVAAPGRTWQAQARRRPRVRGDCVEGPRPCPWATCRHHPVRSFYASARRKYRAAGTRPRESDHYQVPPEWGPAIERGDFAVLPYTCTLDIIEEQGPADEREALFAAIPDLSAVGRLLGITRELARLEVRSAIRTIRLVDLDVAAFLQRGYDESKLKPKE